MRPFLAGAQSVAPNALAAGGRRRCRHDLDTRKAAVLPVGHPLRKRTGSARWVCSAFSGLAIKPRGPGCTSCGERVRPGRERLPGVVEVDETYWGAEEEGVSGRQTERKALIAVAAEERGRGLGRIRMQPCGTHRRPV